MKLTYTDLRRIDDKLDKILEGQQGIDSKLATLISQGETLMDELDAVKQNLDDLEGIAQQYLDFIIAKDALIAEKDAKIAALADQVTAGSLTIAEFKSRAATLVSQSQATEDKMRAALPGVPPVGGTPLDLSYPDAASFSAAVAAYTGPEGVTLDGTSVKAGTSPTLDYFTQSDGSISTVNPTPVP